jgi:uncharacterized membrane protein
MDRLKLAVGIAIGVLTGSLGAEAAYTVPAVNLPAQTPDIVRDRVARSLASTRDQVGRVLHHFHGEFHGLGASAGGSSYATDLSGDGRVVAGYDFSSSFKYQPFVWSPSTGKTAYNMHPSGVAGNAQPNSISADGVYVGGQVTTIGYNSHTSAGFLWSLAGSQSLPTTSGRNREVSALSRDGKVIVGAEYQQFLTAGNSSATSYGQPSSWAYRYTRGGNLQRPGVLTTTGGNFYVNSHAMDVTADGNTVLINGENPTQGFGSEAYLWKANGSLQRLGHFDSSTVGTRRTTGKAISADGSTVVGTGSYGNIGDRAVLWREATGWIGLGELPDQSAQFYSTSVATGVSGNGSIVIGGVSTSPYGSPCVDCELLTTPFHWDQSRGMRELADVLQLDYGLDLAGWSLKFATGISDDGTTIIGNGFNPSGQSEAWRAVLSRTTPLGDIDFDGDVDPQDYAQLTSNLGATAANGAVFYADGDLNADGRVDQSDAATLLGLYQGRRQGDFNADGVVNIADYTLWRDNVGQFTGGLADSNGDGWVNGADLAAWRTHFGRALGSLLPFSIPEPAGATLFAIAFLCVSRRR